MDDAIGASSDTEVWCNHNGVDGTFVCSMNSLKPEGVARHFKDITITGSNKGPDKQ